MFEQPTDLAVMTLATAGATAPPCWEDLVAKERRLALLLAEARAVRRRRGPDFDPLAVFFGYPGFGPGFKRRLSAMVGWFRPEYDALLSSSEAYSAAYATILEALEEHP